MQPAEPGGLFRSGEARVEEYGCGESIFAKNRKYEVMVVLLTVVKRDRCRWPGQAPAVQAVHRLG